MSLLRYGKGPLPRRCEDLIQDYLKYTANTESPTAYHLWACLGLISAALERRVQIRWGHTEIFPNQYIMLIGPSGIRKGEPIVIARSFLEEIGVNLIAEAITREALIRRMKNSSTSFEFPYEDSEGQDTIKWQCAVSCVIEEMAVFLEGDPRFMADLTNWYDARGKWTYETKNQGTDEVNGVCLNILGSMAPDWIPQVIPSSAIGGGFTSRVIFVVEHRKGRTITNPNAVVTDKQLQENILADLEAVKSISGEMIFSPAALEMYEGWYAGEEKKISGGNPPIQDPRFSGYVSRRATHVKKISMAISAARSSSLVITEFDLKRSILLLEQVELNMPETFERLGRAMYAEQTQLIMNFIRERGSSTRREVMKQFYRDVDGKAIEVIEATLRSTGLVQIDADERARTWRYKWVG